MRNTRPEHFSGAKTHQIVCACGCGKKFVPKRIWHKFYSDECRKRAWKSTRITPAKIAEIEFRLCRIEEILKLKKEVESQLTKTQRSKGAAQYRRAREIMKEEVI